MQNTELDNILLDIRKGDLDINVQDLFLSTVIKGLLYNLNDCIKVRNIPVPHYIMHTGDDRMFLAARGYDASIEPLKISNENTIYDIIPKCIVTPSNITLDMAQLTSPYSIGKCQLELNTDKYCGVYALKGEFRRIPLKITVDLKYVTDSYTDMLELMQYIISNLAFIRSFNIMYLGQIIKCSYKIPDSFNDEHSMDIDGAMADGRTHGLNISIELETSIPIFSNKTMMAADKIISTTINNTKFNYEIA